MLIISVVLLFISLGLISASAETNTLPQAKQAENNFFKVANISPISDLITNIPTLTTIDFEGLQTTYYMLFGNTNIGTYYPGVTFGQHAIILDKVIGGYKDFLYPPHSGNAVFTSNEF
jgi:hypothetical protein